MAAGLLLALPCPGQSPDAGAIQDNSFLVEEAYNQETGVVQHISQLVLDPATHDWVFTFTQEWPAAGLAHQLSYSVPVLNASDSSDGTRFVDVVLNYRYQLVGDGNSTVACSPRLSVSLPTGSASTGTGAGGVGLQLNLPLSVVLSKAFVAHANVGATLVPRAENDAGDEARTLALNLGASLVWLATTRFNVLLETIFVRGESVLEEGLTERSDAFFLSPGIRWSHNFASGLQIVPGLAFPIGIGQSAGQRSILAYLSFEHPF